MAKVFIVAGLGFGDEGKGTITEYLAKTEDAYTVVRYNGGAQAAHNVVLSDGREHTFSQFGSATFQGVRTHLSKCMVVDPVALMVESQRLGDLGVSNVFDLLTIEQEALLITPYQKGANRLRELKRRGQRHGSCGVGVGETRSDFLKHKAAVPKAGDLFNPSLLKEKLAFIQRLKYDEFKAIQVDIESEAAKKAFDYLTMPVNHVASLWIDAAKRLSVVGESYLTNVLTTEKNRAVIFEGAQGVLLDQRWGFHPYTTWTDTTLNNAYALLQEAGVDREETVNVGVTRTYMTRHGAGPFPTEDKSLEVRDLHNKIHDWQGEFREGHLDTVLLRYALEVLGGQDGGQIDRLAVTHLDVLPKLPKLCTGYLAGSEDIDRFLSGPTKIWHKTPNDLKHQENLAGALDSTDLTPVYWPMPSDFIGVFQDLMQVKVGYTSSGPTLLDKRTLL